MSGLYINTNVNSMTAATNLTNNMNGLSDVLTRLSTGLRINSAKDDPAGLIASEVLRSEITASTAALKNTQRANSMIATADSALGQVGDLLNDIRGLINEAANTGAMSAEQIEANQLQIDASLDAIDRIGMSTTYMGKKLLDGSMSFQTAGLDSSEISNLVINSANFGTQDSVGVRIDVQAASTVASQVYSQGALGSDGASFKITGSQGSQVFNFGAYTTTAAMAEQINAYSDSTGVMAVTGTGATAGIINITSAGADNDIILEANKAGEAAGNYSIKYSAGNSDGISYTITKGTGDCADTVDFQLQTAASTNASAVTDESQLGIYTKDAGGVLFTSTSGSNVKELTLVLDAAASATTAVFDKTTGIMTVTGTTAGLAAATIVTAVNAVSDSTGISAAAGGTNTATLPTVSGASTTTATVDARANNGLTVSAKTGEDKYNNTDVVILNGTPANGADADFKYIDKAQQASLTAAFDGATTTGVYIQIKANNAGSAYNGYTFSIADAVPAGGGKTAVSIDSENKTIAITADIANGVTFAQIQEAIAGVKDADGKSLFSAEFYMADPAGAATEPAKISNYSEELAAATVLAATTGATADTVGTDHAAMIVTVAEGTTAAEVATAFNTDNTAFGPAGDATDALAKEMRALFSVSPNEGSDGSGAVFLTGDNAGTAYPAITNLYYSGAMKGGQSGSTVVTTAKELTDFINSDETLKELFTASLAANSSTGSGTLSVFDEYALYGCPYDGTALQFLGPDGSKNIEFSTTDANGNLVRNQELGITWTADTPGYSEAHLAATNANASITIKANSQGGEYDDMVVRFKRVTGPEAASSVTYTAGPSNAIAYGNISTAAGDVNGKFIFQAKNGGDQYNNVSIQAKVDTHLSTDAAFTYDEASKTFTISVKNTEVTLEQMMDAFNQSELASTFSFELDYSDTDLNSGGTPADPIVNDATTTFSNLFGGTDGTASAGNGAIVTLGNTGTTGGHTGGVLEINLFDDTFDSTTYDGTDTGKGLGLSADAVVDLINNSSVADKFTASNYAGSTGAGYIMVREDTIGPEYSPGNCDTTVNGSRMITSGGVKEEGKMVINLATDQFGNSITTAADLVAFFDTLTAEQTKGISVSLINPGGDPGSICDTAGGTGLLLPTSYYDNCDNLIENDITFQSACATLSDTTPLAEIVAVNGKEAGFTLFGKTNGTDLEGVTLMYAVTTDSPSVAYDEKNKIITVNINEGTTTASEVKALIEQSAATKDLFSVTLRGEGIAKVTSNDNSVVLTDGTYLAGTKGGAMLLWNKDDTSNEMYIESVETGSDQYVQIEVISGTFNTVDSYTGQTESRSYGTDIEATANGQRLQSTGNDVSLNTTNLSFTATINDNAEAGDSYSFDIVSGGALFQLGPDVISAQQVRLGIPSVMTSDLGGSSGKLSELRSGGRADLSNEQSVKIADRIVKEAITAVSSTRGRLGAIQKATLESNMTTLQNSIEALTAARADIIDADFAEESSNLTKYQILVQSGSRVLSIANQLPQYAASLIG